MDTQSIRRALEQHSLGLLRSRCQRFCLYHRQRHFVYAYVPKVACTSLKIWFAQLNGQLPATLDALGDVHAWLDREACLRRQPARRAAALLADPACYKFAFVRHPFTRIVSAYLNKIVRAVASAESIIRRAQQSLGLVSDRRLLQFRQPPIDRQRSLTFRETVQQLARERVTHLDPHFRPQTLLLDGVSLDFVGRYETLDDDFACVQRQLGVGLPLPRLHQRQYQAATDGDCVADWPAERFRNNGPAPHWRRFYDNQLLRQVAELYALDFQTFAYSAAIDAPLTPARPASIRVAAA